MTEPKEPIRRLANGCIDLEFYDARARRIRSEDCHGVLRRAMAAFTYDTLPSARRLVLGLGRVAKSADAALRSGVWRTTGVRTAHNY